jgi:hypothetical protein
VELKWDNPRDITGVQILFDSSLQFHFGQSWQGYQTNAIPSIVKKYKIVATLADGTEICLTTVNNNYQRNCLHHFNISNVSSVRIVCSETNGIDRVQIYSVRVFGK